MSTKVANKFDLDQEVFLKSDPEQWPRILTYIKITPNGLLYGVTCGTEESEHYDIEIDDNRKL